ncbi:hypothetical protein ACFXG6_25350 [Streptomyces roseus]|uniref:hypothetical protein n=1 Tax=Streptomyces roseus TaxID=66430 RepID=UPI00369B1456
MNGNLTNDEKPDRFALDHGQRWDGAGARELPEQLDVLADPPADSSRSRTR